MLHRVPAKSGPRRRSKDADRCESLLSGIVESDINQVILSAMNDAKSEGEGTKWGRDGMMCNFCGKGVSKCLLSQDRTDD